MQRLYPPALNLESIAPATPKKKRTSTLLSLNTFDITLVAALAEPTLPQPLNATDKYTDFGELIFILHSPE